MLSPIASMFLATLRQQKENTVLHIQKVLKYKEETLVDK